MQEDFDHDLIELDCNVHPLDGLAINVRSIGPELDQQSDVTGLCFGKDGTATNLIKVYAEADYIMWKPKIVRGREKNLTVNV